MVVVDMLKSRDQTRGACESRHVALFHSLDKHTLALHVALLFYYYENLSLP